MSFFFYINNGFASLATLQHFQPYCAYNQEINNFNSFPLCQVEQYNTQVETIESPGQPQQQSLVRHQQNKRKTIKKRTQRAVPKQILSAKKNSESNIINQFYSFFSCRQKSQRIIIKCIGRGQTQQAQAILSIFYQAIKLINTKRGKKYMNTAKFLTLFTEKLFASQISEIKEQILALLPVQQLCLIFRKCANYYLQQTSIISIINSKRISVVSKIEHLKKRRNIVKAMLRN